MGKSATTTRTRTVGTAPAARSWRVWAAAGLLVVAVMAAYGNSFHGPFIFDDDDSIVENPSIRHLWSGQVLTAPPEAITVVGRPVPNLSLAINYALGQLDVVGYHVVNLAIHILAALALLGLVRRTLLLPALAGRFGPASTPLALAVALVWALHPLQTESVTYIIQRAEALVGLFYLLTLYCFVRGVTSARSNVWYAAAVGACALGMASKEIMVSAPLVALLYDRLFISGSFKEGLRRRWGWYLALAATWAILGLLVYLSLGRGGSAGFNMGMTVWEYARTQFGCIIHYLRLAFWPSPLVLDYGADIASQAAEIVPYAIGVGLLLAATAVALARRPKWGFLGVWFFAILAPTSSIVPLVGQTEAEHRMYLPLAAVVALVVLAAYAALQSIGRRFAKAATAVAGALVLVVAAALGWGTCQRNEDYRSALAIWNNTVENCPRNSRAYNGRGYVLNSKGQYDAAIKDYDKALSLKSDYAAAYSDRGLAYYGKGQYDAAIKDFDKALSLKSDYAKGYNNRGNALNNMGQYDAAIKDFDKALSLKSDYAEAYNNRGNALNNKGQYDAAIKDLDKALSLKSDYAEAYNNRGNAFNNKGQHDAAIGDYDKALSLKSDDAEVYNNRGIAINRKGQYDAAIKDFDKALSLKSDYAEAYNNRGNAYDGKGQHDAAIKDYDKAIELRPDNAAAYHNRAIAHCQMKAYDKAWADVKMCRKLGGTPNPKFIEDLTRASGRSE